MNSDPVPFNGCLNFYTTLMDEVHEVNARPETRCLESQLGERLLADMIKAIKIICIQDKTKLKLPETSVLQGRPEDARAQLLSRQQEFKQFIDKLMDFRGSRQAGLSSRFLHVRTRFKERESKLLFPSTISKIENNLLTKMNKSSSFLMLTQNNCSTCCRITISGLRARPVSPSR